MIVTSMSGIFDELGDNVKPHLKKCGCNVKLYPLSKITAPEVIEIGDNSRIVIYIYIWWKVHIYWKIRTHSSL